MAQEPNEIQIFCQEFEQLFVHYAEQIGRGEIFVEDEKPFPVGSKVTISIFLVYEDLPFCSINGSVSSVVESKRGEPGGGRPKGMNIKIEKMDESARSFIVDLVKFQLKNELSRLFTT